MAEKFEKKEITKKSKDFSRWYTDVILKAELADYAPVRGCMVIRPYGYALWENIQKALDGMIKAAGVKNAYFPLFIPYSFLEKEKAHIKGFSPELAIVTHGGGKKLKEPLVIRPTSETVMHAMFAKWIKSWRDLPLLINQWSNAVRWEKRTYLFLRTTEFLWQEGHTCHATHKEARQETQRALQMYIKLFHDWFALPGYFGQKSNAEKFPGAEETYAYEALMPDGKVLQGATSHDLGQNFAEPFNLRFQDKRGKLEYVWQTSWGLSTRSIGALIMAHGDDDGLILPPKLAPVKVVIIPVLGKDDKKVLEFSRKVKEKIERQKSEFDGVVEILETSKKTFGWMANESEIKGIPLALPIGPKEVKDKKITISRRDGNGKLNEMTSLETVAEKVEEMLGKMQKDLFKRSERFLRENTHKVNDYSEFKKTMKTKRGFIRAFWCEDAKCEAKIKEETKATTRLLPLDARTEKGKCLYCGKAASHRWYFAQAY
ncbi:MAG TPA: proline--tRNA ligase [Candidatus Bathyarchaeia archaeon]|nr:proline--tRNA ligase [Candidatus Bathyarchaeia archaeon]